MKKPWKPTAMAREVFFALERLGGESDISSITKEAGQSSSNGVSVTLGALERRGYVKCTWAKRFITRWQIVKNLPSKMDRLMS